ncbi:MAG: hypothetical protein PHE73_00910 [Sulfurovaceae bacterium]|nr:hypothetical protein [Sulfurovaceae bacterium]
MLLSEILEENSVQSINNKTKISIDTLNKIIARDFSSFKKVQAFGFISILEREYGGRIDDLRRDCEDYFASHLKEEVTFIAPNVVKTTSKPQWLLWLAGFGIFALATYFLIQSSTSNDRPEYKEEINATKSAAVNQPIEANTTINANAAEKNITIPAAAIDSNRSLAKDNNASSVSQLKIVPKSKLWFGMMDIDTKELQNSIISDAFNIDMSKQWLIATSKASFSLQSSQGTKEYKDYHVHYFKADKNGFAEITKEEFVTLGGPKRW